MHSRQSTQFLDEGEGRRRREVGGGVSRADQIELGGVALVEPPRDDRGVRRRLPLRRRPQEAAAARHERPLVQVRGVPVAAERRHIERDRAGRMRTIGQHGHAEAMQPRRDLGQRQQQRGVGRNVIDDGDPGARPDGALEGIGDGAGTERRLEDDRAHRRAPFAGGIHRGIRHAAVAEIAHQHLVARREREPAQHGVGAGRGVVDKHHVVAVGMHKGGDRICRNAHPRTATAGVAGGDGGEFAQQEAAGLTLHLVLDGALRLEDTTRCRADGSVIEIGDGRVEQPLAPEMAAVGHRAMLPRGPAATWMTVTMRPGRQAG